MWRREKAWFEANNQAVRVHYLEHASGVARPPCWVPCTLSEVAESDIDFPITFKGVGEEYKATD